MRVLIIGVRGQLVQCLNHISNDYDDITMRFLGRPRYDLIEAESSFEIMKSERPQVVINAAAYTAVDKAEDEPGIAHKINAEAAGIIAGQARKIGAKFIQISTDYVFDGESSAPYVETDDTNPKGVYGSSKLAGELMVQEANPDHIIVRTSWVYSPFGNNFVTTMLRLASDRDEVSVVHDQTGNPTSALDIAEGLLKVVSCWKNGNQKGLGETFHLSGTGSVTWAEFAEGIFATNQKNSELSCSVRRILSTEFPTKAMRPKNSCLNSDKFEQAFEYRAPNWQVSLERVLQIHSAFSEK